MINETIDKLALKYGNIPWMKKPITAAKLWAVRRHSMSSADVIAVETGKADKKDIVEKYRRKWPKHIRHFDAMLRKYYDRCAAAKMEIKSDQAIAEDVLFCYLAYGFLPDEYFSFELMNKSPSQRRGYISDRERLIFVYMVNDIYDIEYVRNKNATHDKFGAYYKRDAVSIRSDADYANYAAFVKAHPVFVLKSVRDNCGNGVQLVDFNKLNISPEAYFKQLRSSGEYLLEERIIQSEAMRRLNDASVNTVRCVTYVTDRRAEIATCVQRIGRNSSFLDNAATGGLIACIDLQTGKLITKAVSKFHELFDEHPETHVKLIGYQLPQWEELRALAQELAEKIPTVRYVGWDFAHTDKGWVLVEGNGRAQLIGSQFFHKSEMIRRMKSVLNAAR